MEQTEAVQCACEVIITSIRGSVVIVAADEIFHIIGCRSLEHHFLHYY